MSGMNIKSIMESAEVFLIICLIFTLVLSAFIFFFVFCTNGEDWFFGIKPDGMPGGSPFLARWREHLSSCTLWHPIPVTAG